MKLPIITGNFSVVVSMSAENYATEQDLIAEHRTAQRLIKELRQIQAAAQRGHALNALYGNKTPDMTYKSTEELLAIAQPSAEELGKLAARGIIQTELHL